MMSSTRTCCARFSTAFEVTLESSDVNYGKGDSVWIPLDTARISSKPASLEPEEKYSWRLLTPEQLAFKNCMFFTFCF